MITHYDLFAGIGGFSLALDNTYENTKHIFVEWDDFCTEVLKKHWPEAEYHKDIRQFIADTTSQRLCGDSPREELQPKTHGTQQRMGKKSSTDTECKRYERNEHQKGQNTGCDRGQVFLTGGFPCQPFSQAGRRRGTEDDRYLWPEMFECIRLLQPDWVIAENVAGLVTWNDGLVLEQVCSDLENEGYEVQPFILPAVSVNAPHRRDRVWIVANRNERTGRPRDVSKPRKETHIKSSTEDTDAKNTDIKRRSWWLESSGQVLGGGITKVENERPDWSCNWVEVATDLCRVDDGLPKRLDRNPRLKALGNAIVPAVAEKIFKVIKDTNLNA